MSPQHCCLTSLGLYFLLVTAQAGHAIDPAPAEWAVVSDVREGDRSASKHLAIFHGTQVYSCDENLDGEITLLELSARRFELLDPQRRIRTTVEGSEVYEAMLQIEERAKRMNPLIRFAAAPTFVMELDQEASRLRFQSDLLSYDVTGVPIDAHRLNAYLDFADWSARLGALRPGGLPAVARLQVNRELRMRQWAPGQVARTIRWQGNTSVAQSQHTFHEVLAADHQQLMTRINQLRDRFTRVDLAQYCQLPE